MNKNKLRMRADKLLKNLRQYESYAEYYEALRENGSVPMRKAQAVEARAGFSFVEVAACLAGLVQKNVFAELFCLYADSDIVIGNLNNSFVFAFSGDVFAVPALEEPAV